MKVFTERYSKFVLAVTLWILLGTNLALAAGALPTRTWSDQIDGGNNGNDAGYSVAIDSHGNVITAGYITGATGHAIDAHAIKYDPNGNVLCTITVDSGVAVPGSFTSSDSFSSVKVDSQDNIILAGTIAANYDLVPYPSGYYCAIYVQKYDSNCNALWPQPQIYHINVSPYDSAWNSGFDLALDKDDNIYVAGAVFAGWGLHEGEWAILKYDKNGVLQSGFPILYDNLVNYAIPEYPYGIAVDSSGNIIACGTKGVSGSPGNPTNDVDWHVRKYDPTGTLIWEHTYSGPANLLDYAYRVTVDSKDNVIVAGYTNVGTNNTTNVKWGWLVIKYAEDGIGGVGQVIWQYSYASPSGKSGAAFNVTVDRDDNVVVAGYKIEASDQVIGRLVLLNGVDGSELDELLFEDGNVVLYGVAQRGNLMAVTGYNGVSPNLDIFTALLSAAPSLIAPAEGTEWESRSKQTILWDKALISGKSKVHLYYSADSGHTWISIKQKALNNGKYIWTVPDISPDDSYDTCVAAVVSANSPGEFVASPLFSVGFPKINDFDNKKVFIGETITITGRFFGTKVGKVNFGKFLGKIPAGGWTPTSITVQVPKNVLTGPFTITTAAKNQETSPSNLVSLPQITKLSPASASVAKVVNIFGSGFGVTQGIVTFFNGVPVPPENIVSWKDTKIMVKVPSGAATGRIKVTNTAPDWAESPMDFQIK
jgi:hypothetical protein